MSALVLAAWLGDESCALYQLEIAQIAQIAQIAPIAQIGAPLPLIRLSARLLAVLLAVHLAVLLAVLLAPRLVVGGGAE